MSMTMTQQILARHCGLESVKAGDLIEVSLDRENRGRESEKSGKSSNCNGSFYPE